MTYLNTANKEKWLSQKLEEEKNSIAKALGKKEDEKQREQYNCENKKRQLKKALDEALQSAYDLAKQSFVLMAPYATQKKEGVECLVIENGKLPNADLGVDLSRYKDNEGKIKNEAKYNEVCAPLYQELGRQQARTHLPALPIGMRETLVDGKTYYTPYYIEWQGETSNNECANFYITYNGKKDEDGAFNLQNSLLIRMLAAFPADKLHITFIDPLQTGGYTWLNQQIKNASKEKDIDLIGKLCNGKIFIESKEDGGILGQLKILRGKIKNIKENILDTNKNEKSLKQHNINKGTIDSNYEIVVMYNPLSKGINLLEEQNTKTLIKEGYTAGIYIIIVQDTNNIDNSNLQEGERDKLLDNHFVHIHCYGTQCGLSTYEPGECNMTNMAYFHSEQLKDVFFNINEDGSRNTSNLLGLFFSRLPEAVEAQIKWGIVQQRRAPISKWLNADYPKDWSSLRIPIGKLGEDEMYYIVNEDRLAHSFIIGSTGSGKSVLVEDIIVSAACKYSPRALQMYLIDFKGGVTTQRYKNIPHVRWSVTTKKDAAILYAMLQELEREQTERSELFKQANVSTLENYNKQAKTENKIPCLLVVFDEFHEVFHIADGTDLQTEINKKLDTIARQGRNVGIHLIMATQDLRKVGDLVGHAKNNTYCFQCESEDLSQIFKKEASSINLNGHVVCVHPTGNDNYEYVEPYFLDVMPSASTSISNKEEVAKKCAVIINGIIDKACEELNTTREQLKKTFPNVHYGDHNDHLPIPYDQMSPKYDLEFGTDVVGAHTVGIQTEDIKSILICGQNDEASKYLTMRVILSTMRTGYKHYKEHQQKRQQQTYVVNPWDEGAARAKPWLQDLHQFYTDGYAEKCAATDLVELLLQLTNEYKQREKAGDNDINYYKDLEPIYLYIIDYNSININKSVPKAPLSKTAYWDDISDENIILGEDTNISDISSTQEETQSPIAMLQNLIKEGSKQKIYIILHTTNVDTLNLSDDCNFEYTIYQHDENSSRPTNSNSLYNIKELGTGEDARVILKRGHQQQLIVPFLLPSGKIKK